MDPVRKCRWRKQEAQRVRKDRVTQGYIAKKYPEIYEEAVEFYMFLNDKYPNKKDLRRTNEMEWLKTGISGETSKKYYSKKNRTTTTSTTTTTISDRMELVIPLMDKSRVPSSSSSQVRQPPVDKQCTEIAPQVNVTPDNEIPGIMATFNEEIPTNIIQDIIEELQSDADMVNFFSDLNEGFDEEFFCS